MDHDQLVRKTPFGILRRRPSFEAWLLMPAVIILLIITIYPTGYMLYMSTIKFSTLPQIPSEFIGLGNWVEMLTDHAIWSSWLTTVIYFLFALGLQIVLGTAIAILIEHSPYLRDFLATALLCPMFLAPVIVGLLWRFMLHDSYGIYTYILRSAGILDKSISLLGNTRTALATVIIIDTWEWTPLIMIIVLSGLRALPVDIIEAAQVDGASFIQQLRYITIPLLRPVFIVALLIRSMDLLRYIDHIMVTTSGGPADATKILAIRIYENAFRFFKLGYASALAITLLIVIIILGRFFINILGIEKEEVVL
jgi:multiple sugar transport system permease protein